MLPQEYIQPFRWLNMLYFQCDHHELPDVAFESRVSITSQVFEDLDCDLDCGSGFDFGIVSLDSKDEEPLVCFFNLIFTCGIFKEQISIQFQYRRYIFRRYN